MIAPDHSCSWTRRRRSTLSRREGCLVGAGMSRPVLEAAARDLGAPLTITPDPESADDADIALGPWRGQLHDGCFVSLEHDDERLRAALLAASLALHGFYLGRPLAPGGAALLAARLAEGETLVLQSRPRDGVLLASRHANDAGWWARLAAPVERVDV